MTQPYRGEGPESDPPETATYLSGSPTEAGADTPGASVFLPSEVLADRFRVVRLLGRGGMGEVYEVEDLELGERVAVKTLRSRLSDSDRALALFRSEVQTARRVTHPNVCRIFDVFRHRRGCDDGNGDSVVFLTMELLPGPTLSAWLRRRGPLSVAAALPLLRQIADALDAAHQAGVVHRDLKSGNVMLVETERGLRAVVTDFGLASLAQGMEGASSSPYGTVPYRAPEVETGAPAGPAVDLFALGVLLYEMLVGRPAVPGAAQLEALPAPAAAAIERCTDPDPTARPRRARDVVRRLDRRRRGWLAAGLAAAAAVLVVLGLGLGLGTPAPPPPLSLAVLASPSAAHDADVDRTTVLLGELLRAELSASRVQVALPDAVYRQADGRTVTAAEPGEAPRPGLAVLGIDLVARFTLDDGDAWAVDVEVTPPDPAGEPLVRFRSRGEAPRRTDREPVWRPLFAGSDVAAWEAVAAETADRLRRVLGERGPPPSAARRRLLLGDSLRALEAYVDGATLLAGLHTGLALPHLRRAVELRPGAYRFQVGLATASLWEWDAPSAQRAAGAAHRLAGDLGEAERLRSEVLQRWSERDWPRAGAAWTRLMRLTGRRDDVFEYFDLVTPSSRYKEAHRQLSEVAERWPSLADDPRFGIRWAGLQRRLEDYEGSLRSVRRARRQARALGDRGIVQRTWLAESVALYSLGRLDESEAAAAEARRMAVELHAPGKLAKVLRQQGNLSMARGDGRRAEELLRRARKLSLATRDRDAAGWCANSLAILAMHRGELATARRYYEETLAVQESRADEFGIVLVRGNLSEALALEGDLGAAEEEAAKVLSRAQTLDISPQLEYQALARLGRVAVERGDADAAERFLARADERGPEDLTNQVEVRFLRARMYLLRGDVQAATAAVGESLELATEKRFALLRLDALAVRGEVEEARGDLEAAVATYHRVVEEAEAVEARIILGYTLPRLGRALRRLGRSDEARRVLDRALEVQAGTGQILETAHSRYELAELELAAGRREHAAAVARQALADADEAGDADRWAEIRDLLRRLGARDEPPLRLAATAEGRR